MNDSPHHTLALVSSVIALASLITAAVIGSGGIALLLVVAVAIPLAIVAWRAERPAVTDLPGSWSRFLGAGVLVLGGLIVVLNTALRDQELTSIQWSLMMLTLMSSFVLIGSGLVLGAARLAQRRHVHT